MVGPRTHAGTHTRSFAGSLPLERLIQTTCAERVDLIPASTSLATLERSLDGVSHALTFLRRAIDDLDPDRWDYLICDTPPNLGIVVNSVLAAVQELYVPVEARPMGLAGLSRILCTAGRNQRRLNHSLCEPRLIISRTNTPVYLARSRRRCESGMAPEFSAPQFPNAFRLHAPPDWGSRPASTSPRGRWQRSIEVWPGRFSRSRYRP